MKVTNPAGSDTSAGAVLLVIPNAPPTITTQPQSQTTPVGSNVSFTVSATGTVPLTYQWSLNGSNVVGATASAYSIPSAQTSMAGGYAVVVTNIYGSVTSAVANLIVGYPPVMVDQIPTVTTSNGNVTTLRCRVTGSNPLAYQWLRLGVAVIDATNTAITLTNIQTYYLVIDIGYTFG